jgi:L,D-transpeptidase YcbB
VLNVPEFRLRALGTDGTLAFESDVVVGRSFQRQTPLFAGRLDRVVFQPSWHVPASIVRRDLLPRVKADAGYLAANGYLITGSVSQEVTSDVLEGLRSGRYGLRQAPGPHNALGAVKFLFPNDHSVYLHGTTATALFDRARRDFSSGCVRVRDVAGLAEWVLRGNPAWPRERIHAALAGGAGDFAVAVSPPIPVFLVYVTAVAAPDGGVYFFEDIYGHDARLQRALAQAAAH